MNENELKVSLANAVSYLEKEFQKINVGRANPIIVSDIPVNNYGVTSKLDHISLISVPDAKHLLIRPYNKSQVKDVMQSLSIHKPELNCQEEGDKIRIIFTPLTSDKRKLFVKDAEKLSENSKIEIRNIRRKFKDEIKKSNASENEQKLVEEKLQKIVDLAITKVVEMTSKKAKQLQQV